MEKREVSLSSAVRDWLSRPDDTRTTKVAQKSDGTVEVTITGRNSPDLNATLNDVLSHLMHGGPNAQAN